MKPLHVQTLQPLLSTEQNLVLLSGWIKYEICNIIGRNQKSESFWSKIVEYCNKHCSFGLPRGGVSCKNHYNYMNLKLGLIQLYEQVYRKTQTEDDLQKNLHVSETWGFPEISGSIDCMYWNGKIVPKRGKDNILGEIRELPLLFLKRSQPMIYVSDMLFWMSRHIERYKHSRSFTSVRICWKRKYSKSELLREPTALQYAYYLVEGIYPSYPTFVKSIRLPQSEFY